MDKRIGSILPPLLAVSALALGLWVGITQFHGESLTPVPIQSGARLNPPRALKPFSLMGADGSPFTLGDLHRHWTFLAIGYTHCPDVCPTLLATFDAIDKQTRESRQPPRFLFISVDPERDTPEKLGEYVRYFNPDFLGATGTHENLQYLSSQLGIIYAKVEGENTSLEYLVDHSASILLIDPQGRLSALFSPPHDPSDMANDYIAISMQGTRH